MNKLMTLCAFATVAAASTVNAQGMFDPPGKTFNLYSTNTNDGYSGSRGVLFTVNSNLNANSLHFDNNMGANETLTWEIWKNGIFDFGTTSNTGAGGNQVYTVSGGGYLLTSGNSYELSVSFQGNAVENRFYGYDPNVFGDAPFNVGVITVSDGTAGHGASNFVMPRMGINVPGPASAALLGLGGLVATRRRR